jgi:CBS domain-containing protein
MGFTRVFEYPPGRVGWAARGMPTEGRLGDRGRVGPLARDLPRCGPDATIAEAAVHLAGADWCAVVGDGGVLLGLLRSEALALEPDRRVDTVMIPGPGTVRPHLRVADLARQLDADHLDRVLVTTAEGHLVGVVHRADLRVAD